MIAADWLYHNLPLTCMKLRPNYEEQLLSYNIWTECVKEMFNRDDTYLTFEDIFCEIANEASPKDCSVLKMKTEKNDPGHICDRKADAFF